MSVVQLGEFPRLIYFCSKRGSFVEFRNSNTDFLRNMDVKSVSREEDEAKR